MSIVKMKRVRLIALAEDRDALLAGLLHAGCLEVREPTDALSDPEMAALLRRDTSGAADARVRLNLLKQAVETLDRYAPQKGGGLFAPRAPMAEKVLLDPKALEDAVDLAEEITAHAKNIASLSTRETRLEADRLALLPWENEQLPLETTGTRTVSLLLGTVPSSVVLTEMTAAVEEAAGEVEITCLSSDREQHCLEILVHKSVEAAALEALRRFGFSFSQLKEMTGTVSENLRRIEGEQQECRRQREVELKALEALAPRKKELQVATDRINQVIATETVKERVLTGGAILYLEGWVPVPELPALEETLNRFDCAWEASDPVEEEYPEVPVQLKNNVITRPLNMVTEMYSLPAYDGVDPNPLMAPFFILFYGIMMADMGYGLLMMLAAVFVLRKAKPEGTMAHLFGLMGLCGISTFIMGAITGGFFGDFLTQLTTMINPANPIVLPSLFTPLDDTLMILIGAMALGFVQIVTGMAISLVEKCKRGEFMDAFWEEITWWVVFAGIGLMALGVTNIVLYVSLGLVVLGPLVTGKGFGKITGIFGSLYNHVTGFFGDILSYSRLMALMLAGSVIAQVFNTLGAIPGNVVVFFIISLAGNALNFALNLLGCYVHDLRLQCLEYFGKFYKDGGQPFRPLKIQTKYVEVVKE